MASIVRWMSEWFTVIAPIAGGLWALWRYVLLPRVWRPAAQRRAQRHARDARIDQMLEHVELIRLAVGPNGGKSILDRVIQIQGTVRIAAARQALLSDFVEHPLFEADIEGSYTRINVAFERLSGYSNAEVRGMGWKNLVHEGDRERVSKEWGHAVKDRRMFRTVCRLITKTNLIHKVEMIARPAIDDSNQMVTTWMGAVAVLAADRSTGMSDRGNAS